VDLYRCYPGAYKPGWAFARGGRAEGVLCVCSNQRKCFNALRNLIDQKFAAATGMPG